MNENKRNSEKRQHENALMTSATSILHNNTTWRDILISFRANNITWPSHIISHFSINTGLESFSPISEEYLCPTHCSTHIWFQAQS